MLICRSIDPALNKRGCPLVLLEVASIGDPYNGCSFFARSLLFWLGGFPYQHRLLKIVYPYSSLCTGGPSLVSGLTCFTGFQYRTTPGFESKLYRYTTDPPKWLVFFAVPSCFKSACILTPDHVPQTPHKTVQHSHIWCINHQLR